MIEEDAQLLRRYYETKSEDAFAELVRRHLDLVYAVALRQVGGDRHLAEDVAQVVFTALARKAGELARRPILGGWLYRAAQFAAIDAVRTASRRHARETQALAMHEITTDGDAHPPWEKLRPELDRVMSELDEDDRDAVVLRFFNGCSFGEIGATLRLPENTARMRVERALDKMHALLARRGVTSTAAALGLALANQAGLAAPAGLAATVTSAAVAAGTAAATAGVIGGGILTFMTTGKIALGLAGVAAIAGLGAAFVSAGTAREAETALANTTAQQAALVSKLNGLENRVQLETRRLQQAELENGRLLAAAQTMQAAGAEVPERITSEIVKARFNRAKELARTGDPAEALRELLWCYDVGMARIGSMGGMRYSDALDALADLAERHPPARAALLERQEKARKAMLADAQDIDAAQAFGAISRVLKDGAATIAMLDQLPADDRRRTVLAMQANDDLIAARRYAVAMEGRRPYGMVSSMLEGATGRPNRTQEIGEFAKSVEVFAGAGDLAHARSLAERLLKLDGSEATRALIQKHAARAGHPELLTAPIR